MTLWSLAETSSSMRAWELAEAINSSKKTLIQSWRLKTLLSLRTWTQKSHQQMLHKQTDANLADALAKLESGGATHGQDMKMPMPTQELQPETVQMQQLQCLLFAWSQQPLRRLWHHQKPSSGSKLWMRSVLH